MENHKHILPNEIPGLWTRKVRPRPGPSPFFRYKWPCNHKYSTFFHSVKGKYGQEPLDNHGKWQKYTKTTQKITKSTQKIAKNTQQWHWPVYLDLIPNIIPNRRSLIGFQIPNYDPHCFQIGANPKFPIGGTAGGTAGGTVGGPVGCPVGGTVGCPVGGPKWHFSQIDIGQGGHVHQIGSISMFLNSSQRAVFIFEIKTQKQVRTFIQKTFSKFHRPKNDQKYQKWPKMTDRKSVV